MTTYGDIGQRTAAYASADMLDYAHAVSVLAKFGDNKALPKNKSDTIKFRRPVPFSAVTVPLAEGVTPAAGTMTWEDVTVQLLQWGDLFMITDKVEDMSEDPVLKTMTELCGDQAQKTVEQLIWSKIKAGTNVAYANGASRSSVNTAVALNDVRKAVRYLQSMKARKVTKMLSPSINVDTQAIEAAYIGFCHTDLQADIRAMTGFVPVSKYGAKMTLCPEEFGTVEDVRFITSPELTQFADAGGTAGSAVLSTTGTQADVYPIVIVGQNAFGVVPLKGAGAIEPTVINPSTRDKSDPLGQRGYVGWKTWTQATILNQTWIYRLEVGASVLTT